jgi:hypothetical protein
MGAISPVVAESSSGPLLNSHTGLVRSALVWRLTNRRAWRCQRWVVQRPTDDHGVVGADVGPLAGGSDIDLQARSAQGVAEHLGDPGGAAHLGAVGDEHAHHSHPQVVTTSSSVVAAGRARIGQTAPRPGDHRIYSPGRPRLTMAPPASRRP